MKLSFQKFPRNRLVREHEKSIIFLHGMGGKGQIWRPVAALLEDDYTVLCPDQRGHGDSRVPDSETAFAPGDFARDLDETFYSDPTLDADLRQALAEPAWVIGHSMGGRTAAAFAALYPHHVAGLVIVDIGLTGAVGGGVGDILGLFVGKLPDSFPSRTEAREFLAIHCPDPAIAQYLLAVSHQAADGTITFPFQKHALLETIEQTLGAENGDYVRTFAAATGRPVLVMHGGQSLVYEADAFARDQERMRDLPNVRFRDFPDAGHGLPFEKRADFIAALRAEIEGAGRAG